MLGLRTREIDPTPDRLVSSDTVQPNAPGSPGYDVHAYVADNPTTWVDPSGHNAFTGTVDQIDGSTTGVAGPDSLVRDDPARRHYFGEDLDGPVELTSTEEADERA